MIRLGVLAAALVALVTVSAHAADPALSEEANYAFLQANAQKPGVIKTPSGLQYKIIQNGFGKRPTAFDRVQVAYTGELINGTVFDSVEELTPATFQVNEVIPGWTEALELMREGDHWQLVIPPNLGYGARGSPGGQVPPNQTLVFDVKLIKVLPPEKDQQNQDDEDQSGSGGGY